MKLLESFKKDVLKAEWQQKVFKGSYLARTESVLLESAKSHTDLDNVNSNEICDASQYGTPVFLLQPVPFNNHVFNCMFFSRCENFVCKGSALDFLPDGHAENIIKGPIDINGVGCNQVVSQHGHYSVELPIYNGGHAEFNGICLDVITGAMPPYPVREVRKSIVK